jgi:hypothetical protein
MQTKDKEKRKPRLIGEDFMSPVAAPAPEDVQPMIAPPPEWPLPPMAELPMRPQPQLPQQPQSDPALGILQRQLAQMDQPQGPRGFWETLQHVGQGISTMPPAQFQQIQQQKLGQEFAMKQQQRQNMAQQIQDLQNRQRQQQQDAMAQTRFGQEQEMFPLQMREATAQAATAEKNLNAQPARKYGQRDVEREGKKLREYYDEQEPGVATDTIELGPLATQTLAHREVERGGKKLIEYYEPSNPTAVVSTVEAGTVKREGGAGVSPALIDTIVKNPAVYWDLSAADKAQAAPMLAQRGFAQWDDPAKSVTRATVPQNRAYGFYNRAKQAEDILTQLGPEVAKKGLGAQLYMNVAPNAMQSQTNQSYEQAKRAFVTAYLRRDSGAVISPSEFADADRTYFPVPGDTPKTLKQKAASRKAIMEGMIKEAGPALSENEGLTDVDIPSGTFETPAPPSDGKKRTRIKF